MPCRGILDLMSSRDELQQGQETAQHEIGSCDNDCSSNGEM